MGKFNIFDICGIGMSTLDLVQVVESFPDQGGVTQVLDSQLMGGGPVPSALCAASRLGARTAMIDRIGNDWRGYQVLSDYKAHGVSTESILLEDDRTTTFASILVRKEDGERHIIFSPGTFSPLSFDELPHPTLESTRILHLNGRHWPACLEAARFVKSSGGLVSFDGGAHRYQPEHVSLLEVVDILIVAREYASQHAKSTDIESQLDTFQSMDPLIIGITDGANGSWFASREGTRFHQPAYPVSPVIDTTGCGDAFHGGFLYAQCRGWPLERCAAFASATAGINATALGGRGHLASLEDTLKLMKDQ